MSVPKELRSATFGSPSAPSGTETTRSRCTCLLAETRYTPYSRVVAVQPICFDSEVRMSSRRVLMRTSKLKEH
jgi:hypothetical protein